MEKNSEAKHVVVSGGAKGLGLALTKSLLESRFKVSAFSRVKTPHIQELLHNYKDRLFYKEVNITDAEKLKSFIKQCISKNGNIYGLINNAAVAQEGILATLPEIEVRNMIAINLEGAIRITRLCLRNMILTPGGRIVNISSIIGSRGYNGLSVYSATKAGLDGLARSLARELGGRQITVNSIAPGYMQTDMSSGLSQEQLKQIVRRTPMKKLTRIEDIVPLVQFLLSDGAGQITGQTILVDGGISC